MLVAASGIDYFHHLMHTLVRGRGGPGSLAQLRLRLDRPCDADALARAWQAAGRQAWILGGEWRTRLRGPAWSVRGPTQLRLERCPALSQDVDGTGVDGVAGTSVADAALHTALPETGPRVRLQLSGESTVILTWDHRLLDARGALGLLAALPGLATGHQLGDRWWMSGHRQPPGLPAELATRGTLARQAIDGLRPHRLARIWRPPAEVTNAAVPLVRASLRLAPNETLRMDARSVVASGRFSETPFLLACLAAALAELRAATGGGPDAELLFPLAMDLRPRQGGPLLTNCHSFIFLRQAAGLALTDLPGSARAFKEAQRRWLAAEMPLKMASSLAFFPWLGERFGRAQLGNFRAGIAATCLVGNAGLATLPDPWFGAHLTDIGHAATVPGRPGLSVLFHRHGGRFGCDIQASSAVATSLPPARLAERLRHQLLQREFHGAPA